MGKQKTTYYYAVRSGRNAGVYKNWNDCKSEVNGYKNAAYKKFKDEAEAKDYVQGIESSISNNPVPKNNQLDSHHSNANSHSESDHSDSGNHSNSHQGNANRSSYRNFAIKRSIPEVNQDTSNDRYISSFSLGSSEEHRITPQVGKRKFTDEEYQDACNQNQRDAFTRTFRKKAKVVYTDGASSNNGKAHASAGYGVYWGDNDPRNASVKLSGEAQTNQRAEASAVIHALEQSIDDYGTLEIRTDSQYVINAADNWSKKWSKNNWKSANGKEVQNRDLFEKMLKLRDGRKGKVVFTYVPGHQGVDGNEKADRLAVAGARK